MTCTLHFFRIVAELRLQHAQRECEFSSPPRRPQSRSSAERPLSDVPRCETACDAIAARRLFAAESLAAHTAALAALLARVQATVLAARPAWLTGLKMATIVETGHDVAPMV